MRQIGAHDEGGLVVAPHLLEHRGDVLGAAVPDGERQHLEVDPAPSGGTGAAPPGCARGCAAPRRRAPTEPRRAQSFGRRLDAHFAEGRGEGVDARRGESVNRHSMTRSEQDDPADAVAPDARDGRSRMPRPAPSSGSPRGGRPTPWERPRSSSVGTARIEGPVELVSQRDGIRGVEGAGDRRRSYTYRTSWSRRGGRSSTEEDRLAPRTPCPGGAVEHARDPGPAPPSTRRGRRGGRPRAHTSRARSPSSPQPWQ